MKKVRVAPPEDTPRQIALHRLSGFGGSSLFVAFVLGSLSTAGVVDLKVAYAMLAPAWIVGVATVSWVLNGRPHRVTEATFGAAALAAFLAAVAFYEAGHRIDVASAAPTFARENTVPSPQAQVQGLSIVGQPASPNRQTAFANKGCGTLRLKDVAVVGLSGAAVNMAACGSLDMEQTRIENTRDGIIQRDPPTAGP
jgi:hypothetical protein